MSCNYAENLSPYDDKGILGTPEIFESPEIVNEKVEKLVDMILAAKHVVVHTGAGISTSTGIPDFRGPTGVWTLEEKGVKPKFDVDFQSAVPSKTHRALKALMDRGFIKFIISQNIDGLHLRSGIKRDNLAELHGNFFISECPKCKLKFVRTTPVPTVGLKPTGETCKSRLRSCRGKLVDTILDWEGSLPDDDLELSIMHSTLADLNIGLGSSFQIMPSGKLPLRNKKFGGKFALVNLQPIKVEKTADLVIHSYVDDVMDKVLKRLGIEDIPEYNPNDDPTRNSDEGAWNIENAVIKKIEKVYKEKVSRKKTTKDEDVKVDKKKRKVEEDK